jgi:oxygen-independent coproporphyrinogen-3 oxidase
MMNILRLPQGFPAIAFNERTGLDINRIGGILTRAQDDGLLHFDSDQVWRPTPLGLRFLDDLQARFLPSSSTDSEKNPAKLAGNSVVSWSDRTI